MEGMRFVNCSFANQVAIAKCGEETVSVAIEEIKQEDWPEKVYKPDILNNPEKLYKKPGYNPFK
jgi:4-oxalocrotonate tautomerase